MHTLVSLIYPDVKPKAPLSFRRLIMGFMGMMGPIIFGIIFDHLEASLLATLGAMFIIGGSASSKLSKGILESLMTVLVGTTSVFLGSLEGGQSWQTALWIVGLSFIVAHITGMGRQPALLGIQFLVFFIIGSGFGSNGGRVVSLQFAFVFGLGAAWATFLSLIFRIFFKQKDRSQSASSTREIPFKMLFKHWKKMLKQFKGWEFPIRIGLCMVTAETVGLCLGQDRSYWIPLTVILITHRRFASALQRIFQRGLGTVMGVLVGSLLLLLPLSHVTIVFVVGMLTAFRPLLKERSYFLYSMLMTPLMVIMYSVNNGMTDKLLVDRLLDTCIGCAISFFLGYLIWQFKPRAKTH
ncbi:FUSC family protein [Pullulanibacillus pueri]|uniref:FUSC family protein n=1 Tax=Pullulanibacillus pueri TaxID=1437324 RepID=UPI00166E83FE|nr:FUSC family protein [Pullulanibacillus pueri]